MTLHHVEIPLARKDVVYHYSVITGPHSSPDATFKGYPTSILKVAVVADWQGRPNLDAILKDDVHLLLTAGDNIARVWDSDRIGVKDCTASYEELIDAYPDLFKSIPFMPVLGNHDKEIRPRGDRPPAEGVYDIAATAFREFFELPGDEWKWYFDVPDFGVRFVALDLNHISDLGTTWQACHSYKQGSLQYEWYRELMDSTKRDFVITLYNEQNSAMRHKENLDWHRMFSIGTICISGFGHFAERAVHDNVAYYNTALSGTGDKYPDPKSVFLASKDNYMLMTFTKEANEMIAEIKGLDGSVLDTAKYYPLPTRMPKATEYKK
ncbi:MAG: metallophosphoesterase [Planctomycetota bacterium]